MATGKKKLKIAIMGAKGYPYVYGGYDTMIRELGERLVKKGVHVRVYNHRALFPVKPRYVNGIECIYTIAIESKKLTQLSHSFFSMMHACFSDIDVILVVNSANGPFGAIARFFRKKTVINVDGLEWLRPKWHGIASKYFFWASKMATKYYDQLINDSDEMQRVYKELFNADSKVIAYGANPQADVDSAPIEKWGFKSQEYFLIVGRLIPDNNADLIIQGFLESDSRRKLVIVGDVPFDDDYAMVLKQKEDERVLFLGYVTDPNELAAWYSHCFAYFHGHEYGGTNPAMLKALGFGCAILALDTPFNQEMLQNGKHGWYFKKNTASVKDVIEAAESSTERMAYFRKTAREGLIQRYNWDYVTDQYLEVFEQLSGKKVMKNPPETPKFERVEQ
ncbi:glycosyltransferase [Algoriphagus sp. AGSA1]|uniref:glycosyltransferase n=1 Tax=Algoriphagus sp. AGSA1 TaxID=2907213 RepID=UPI001F38A71E|nr:glycosyltransferase [Algoriphagus sp. AGSA1]MCE7055970.1 glycosyltransferase [Algoriphagus sp. AGSA1]